MYRNVAANYLGRLYSAASVYLFIPFYIRYLGVESYGVIAFYAVLLTFASLADVGLSSVLAREAARKSKDTSLFKLLCSIEHILLAASSAIAIGIYLAAPAIADRWLNLQNVIEVAQVSTAIRLMALMIVPQLAFSLYVGGLMGLQRQVHANALQSAFITLRAGLVIPLIAWRPDLELFFAWQLVVTLVFAVIARHMLVGAIGGPAFSIAPFDRGSVAPHLKFSGGLFVVSAVAILNTQLDKLLASKLFSIEQFSYYVLAGTLAQLPLVAVGPLVATFLPRLSALSEQAAPAAASRLYESCSFLVALLSSVSSAIVMLFAEELLRLWLGRDSVPQDAVAVARILAAGGLCLAIGSSPYYFGLANGHSRTSAIVNVVILLVSVPLLLVLASRHGLVGAAIPWIVLNGASLIVVSTIIHRYYYAGSALTWWGKFTLLPALAGSAPLLAGRAIADSFGMSPISACLLAAVCGGAGVIVMVMWRARTHGLGIGDA